MKYEKITVADIAELATGLLPGIGSVSSESLPYLLEIRLQLRLLQAGEPVKRVGYRKVLSMRVTYPPSDERRDPPYTQAQTDTLRRIYVESCHFLSQVNSPQVYAECGRFADVMWVLYSWDYRIADLGMNLQEHVDIFGTSSRLERRRLLKFMLSD